MKQILAFLMLLLCYVLCGAQATTLVVDNQTPGWLSSKINYGDQQTVQNLTVTGYLNADDLKFIGTLVQKHSLSGLVDIEDCQIINQEGVICNSLDKNSFSFGWQENHPDGYSIRHLKLPIELSQSKNCLYSGGHLTVDTLTAGGKNMPKINEYTFSSHNYNIRHLILREGVSEIERYSFWGIPTNSSFVRNYSEAIASEYLMGKCSLLESVELPNTLKIVGEKAFDWCLRLRKVNLPDSIETIGEYAFGMSSFQPDTLRLPQSLKQYYVTSFYIKDNQVIYVPEITSIGFGENVGGDKGQYVDKSNILTFYMQAPQKPSILNKYSEDCLSGCTFYVPKGALESYAKPDIDRYSGYNFNPFCFAKVIELIPVESILVNPNSISLRINEQTIISASVFPINAIDKTYSWYSDDESIAKISSSGLITAVSPGLVKIYAASNSNPDIKDFCEVSVIQPATGIKLDKTEVNMLVDESIRLVASVLPENATNKSVNWVSSDLSVAMVSPDGTVYAIKPGQATIMATSVDGGFAALCKVTVSPIMVENITITPELISAEEGHQVQLVANVLPENATDKSLVWTSSDNTIASVSQNGLVKIQKAGKAQIIATAKDGSDVSATCDVEGYSGFEDVLVDNNTKWDLYNMQGVLVKSRISNDDISNILPGYYILRSSNKSIKIRVSIH